MKTIKDEAKEQKRGFLRILFGTLGATISHKIFETNSSFHVK